MDVEQARQGLAAIVGEEHVLTSRAERAVYCYDASVFRGRDLLAVVFPETATQVSQIVRWCHQHRVPYIARGTGTAISGGAIPTHGGIVIELARMNRVLEIDLDNQAAVVEPGVINQDLKELLAAHGYGYTYVPDPGSQVVSTIGGNVATNAGGMHCLKYGITSNHILGLEVVLPGGDIVEVGGKVVDQPGADLTGLLVGSEGTLGIVTKIVVRLLRLPEAVVTQLALFKSVEDAASAVSAIIAAGILPAALELLDRAIMRVIDQAIHVGYPEQAGAALIIELDGLRDDMPRTVDRVAEICKAHDVISIETAQDAEASARLWLSRRAAFGAMARLAPHCYIVDGCVPRTKLPEALRQVIAIGKRYGLSIVNLAHAGDGNLHPGIPFNKFRPEETAKVLQAGREILEVCVALGGSITGEHGVGIEKQNEMLLMFSATDLEVMRRLKRAHDPEDLCNPKKIFPLSLFSDAA
ncbi:MAG: FAD-binding protein [Candidatus Tectimicrobiota bacterium]|nr:MAG: FAD-binding protein [Candidatus Tectomicrobia bacterium]